MTALFIQFWAAPRSESGSIRDVLLLPIFVGITIRLTLLTACNSLAVQLQQNTNSKSYKNYTVPVCQPSATIGVLPR